MTSWRTLAWEYSEEQVRRYGLLAKLGVPSGCIYDHSRLVHALLLSHAFQPPDELFEYGLLAKLGRP
jgi:hypothetical protein